MHLKEEKQAPMDGSDRLMELENRVACLEVNRLEKGWLQHIEDLEARISRLEVARLEEAWSHATGDVEARVARLEEGLGQRAEANAISNSSSGVVAHPTGQANSVSATAKGAVQPGTNSFESGLQRSDCQNVVVQEEMHPRCSSRHMIKKAISPMCDMLASPRGSSIPRARPQRSRWLRRNTPPRNSSRSNDNPPQHRGPSRDRRLGNQFPTVSAYWDQNRVLLPTQASISGHQQVFSNV